MATLDFVTPSVLAQALVAGALLAGGYGMGDSLAVEGGRTQGIFAGASSASSFGVSPLSGYAGLQAAGPTTQGRFAGAGTARVGLWEVATPVPFRFDMFRTLLPDLIVGGATPSLIVLEKGVKGVSPMFPSNFSGATFGPSTVSATPSYSFWS